MRTAQRSLINHAAQQKWRGFSDRGLTNLSDNYCKNFHGIFKMNHSKLLKKKKKKRKLIKISLSQDRMFVYFANVNNCNLNTSLLSQICKTSQQLHEAFAEYSMIDFTEGAFPRQVYGISVGDGLSALSAVWHRLSHFILLISQVLSQLIMRSTQMHRLCHDRKMGFTPVR